MRSFRDWGVFVVVVLSVFIATECLAQNPVPDVKSRLSKDDEQKEQKDIFELNIPSEWGRIKEVYRGSKDSKQVIVHIQDAHCNYDAQINIGNILDRLVQDHGVKVAGLEGSSGKVKTYLFSTFPEEDIRAQAVDYFVRQGQMNGAEALVIREGFEYPLELYGIEKQELYDDNFNAFKTSLPFKSEAKMAFISLDYMLTQLKLFLYNRELLNFDVQQTAYADNRLSLNEYSAFLSEELKKYKIKKSNYKHFSWLGRVNKSEGSIDFVKAEEERTRLLTELTNILEEADIQKLLDKGMDYRNGYLSAAKYLSFVKDLAQANKVELKEYKNLTIYIDYAQNYDQINSALLFDEMWQIEDAVRAKLYTNDEQKTLDIQVRGLETMKRLVDIKMVNRDLSFYQMNSQKLKSDAYISFITDQAKRFNIKMELPSDIGYLDVYIPAWVQFYQVAGTRDIAMIENSLKLLEEKREKIIAMVTGGFHTRELTRLLKERDISYMVITPHITNNDGNRYFEILEGKKTDLDIFVEQASILQ